MTAFLHRLKSAWLYLRYVPVVDAYDHEDYWTKEDADAYTAFMRSPTGLKLANRANNLVTKSAVNATRAAANQTYSCAWANGVAATFTWLDSHKLREKQEPESDTEQRLSDFMERFRA